MQKQDKGIQCLLFKEFIHNKTPRFNNEESKKEIQTYRKIVEIS